MIFKRIFSFTLILGLCAPGAYADVTASRVIPTTSATAIVRDSNDVVARSATTRTAPIVQNSATQSKTTISRSAITKSDNSVTVRESLSDVASRNGASARTSNASLNNTAAVKRAGVTLRNSFADVGGRGTIAGTNSQTGSNVNYGNDTEARNLSVRSATTTAESLAAAKETLEKTAELNASCQVQYNECMDQFCSVVDANQKRCSCSANVEQYADVEEAVKNANTELNEVAQRIRYVGLSADEIRAILDETEAEEVLSTTEDNTESREMLSDIEKLIQDPTTILNTSSSSSGFGLDINFDFSSDSSDLFNLDFLGGNTDSFSNMRGSALYNAAKDRCETILDQCVDAGGNKDQVTGNYDLAIDKDCIAYETGLEKMNDTLKSNVRSANQMLQQARLAVLQNENTYDAKGCIGALETCMTDDMVCGADYEKCLDPTKKYIDENGEVVLGQNVSNITTIMEDYDNAAINMDFLQKADSDCSENDGGCVVNYLLSKIGMGQTTKDGGLCRAVLDKCKTVSYDDDRYDPYNDVVLNYIQRAMVNIKADQQKIISDYASNCLTEVASCYNQQVSQVNSWVSGASSSSVYNIMRGACRNVALTCSYAVFAKDTTSCPENNEEMCIDSVSEMFYQSLLCPNNSTYTDVIGVIGTDNYINANCVCSIGFEYWGGSCVSKCVAGYSRNQSTGVCVPFESSCISGQEWVASQNKCMNNCGTNEERNTTTGVCECPTDTHEVVDGTCMEKCTDLQARLEYNNQCVNMQDCGQFEVVDVSGAPNSLGLAKDYCRCDSGYEVEDNGAGQKFCN